MIIDCSKLSTSIGAIASGYINFDPHIKIEGIILNKVASDKHLDYLKEGLKFLSIPIAGTLFRQKNIELPSRHLGLIPAGEINSHNYLFEQLLALATTSFNWDLLLPLIENKNSNNYSLSYFFLPEKQSKVKIGIAYDKAFNFYYQDNLDVLSKLGVEIIFFSPLIDGKLPKDLDGIYLGGGFPEIFAQQLAENLSFKTSLREKILTKIPVYAECGGMMYLSEAIEDFEGKNWKMLGILPNTAIMSSKLTLGYRQATVLKNNCFAHHNITLWGHEFHRAKNSHHPDSPVLEIREMYQQKIVSYQGWESQHIFASYLHLHFASCISQVEYFLQRCLQYQKRRDLLGFKD